MLMSPDAAGASTAQRSGVAGVLLRAGLFLLFIRISHSVFGWALNEALGYFPAAALSIFAAASLATALVLRVFERAHLSQVGMGWNRLAAKHLQYGVLAGVLLGALVSLAPVACGLAHFEKIPDPAAGFAFGKLIFVTVLLLFGVVGEEMMFRGYAFQIVLRTFGPWATILPFALIFAWAHSGNLNASPLGLANTALWGVLLGYAVYRSGSLWLPIGLHFGWNWALPAFGTNLSGFNLSLSGYTLNWTAPEILSGGAYGPEGGLVTTVAGLGLGWWLSRGGIERQEGMLLHPDKREDGIDAPASHSRAVPGAPGGTERKG